MKRMLVALVASGSLSASAPAVRATERGECKVQIGGKTIAIDYGRPALQGRDMIGRAEVGQTWRLGADAPTSMDSEVDLAFGDVVVPAGKYALTATRASEDRWSLNLEKRDPENFRAPGTTVAAVPLEIVELPASVETFTIEMNEIKKNAVQLDLKWDTKALRTTFSATKK